MINKKVEETQVSNPAPEIKTDSKLPGSDKSPKKKPMNKGVQVAIAFVVAIGIFAASYFLVNQDSSEWGEEVSSNFMNACVSSATGPTSPISEDMATNYCQCNLDEFKAMYSEAEFTREEKNWSQGNVPKEVEDVINGCLDSSGISELAA